MRIFPRAKGFCKFLLGHSHTHSSTVYSCDSELSHCNRDLIAHKAENIYCLKIKKILLIPVLEP